MLAISFDLDAEKIPSETFKNKSCRKAKKSRGQEGWQLIPKKSVETQENKKMEINHERKKWVKFETHEVSYGNLKNLKSRNIDGDKNRQNHSSPK